MPNNHTQILEIHCKTKEQTKEITKFLQGKNGDIDFNSIVQCKCYACWEGQINLPKECQEDIIKMWKNCVNEEKQWCNYLFKDGSIIGLNERLLSSYVEFIANKRMKALKESKWF